MFMLKGCKREISHIISRSLPCILYTFFMVISVIVMVMLQLHIAYIFSSYDGNG
jgi:hypothetical protein